MPACFECGAKTRGKALMCDVCLAASDAHQAAAIEAERLKRADPERTRRAVLGTNEKGGE